MSEFSPLSKKEQEIFEEIKAALYKSRQFDGYLSSQADKDNAALDLYRAVVTNPKLLECDLGSIIMSCLRVYSLGLRIGEEAYLVPYKGQVTPQVGYVGYQELFRLSGVECNCVLVYEKDEFVVEFGTTPFIKHVPSYDSDRGKVKAAYMVAEWYDNSNRRFKFNVMTTAEIMALKPIHTKPGGPWDTATGQMMKKTVLKASRNYLPRKAPKLVDAVRLDNALEAAESGDERLLAAENALARTPEIPAPQSTATKILQIIDKENENGIQGQPA